MHKYALLPMLLFAAGCSIREEDLLGKWQATAFFEEGQTREMPLSEIEIEFFAGDRYRFQSTFKYSEAGRFHCSLHYLFLTDTTAVPENEKIVKVLLLEADSLKIRMEQGDRTQVLFLGRKK